MEEVAGGLGVGRNQARPTPARTITTTVMFIVHHTARMHHHALTGHHPAPTTAEPTATYKYCTVQHSRHGTRTPIGVGNTATALQSMHCAVLASWAEPTISQARQAHGVRVRLMSGPEPGWAGPGQNLLSIARAFWAS